MDIPPRFLIEEDDPDLLRRFSAYIRKVVKYARLEYCRGLDYRTREISLDEAPPPLAYEDPPPGSPDDFSFTEDRLSEAFARLSLLRQRILTLVFAEGLPALEVAGRLNCSVDYVYLQKHRALKKLRNQLMEGCDNRGE
jgi:RNA polymerase sigma factor (sigma-70 family)